MFKGFVFRLQFLILIFASSSYGAESFSCENLLSPRIKSPKERPIRFMSFNVENLYLHKGEYQLGEDGLERVNQDHLLNQKEEAQTLGAAKAILELRPEFVFLQEVEGEKSLERFNRDYLGDEYNAFWIPTNDSRESGIALLVRKSLGLRIELDTFEYRTWKGTRGERERVFSRNFPVFQVYKEGAKAPSLILAGVHLKSPRDRKNDPKSYLKRQAELRHAEEILGGIMEENPQAPVIVMGDFNSGRGDKEVSPTFENLHMTDPHLSEEHFKDAGGLGHATHTYHPSINGVEQAAVESVVDRAFVSQDLVDSLVSAAVYRYRDIGSGVKKPLPKTIAERKKNPSDHFPIYFDLDVRVLFD